MNTLSMMVQTDTVGALAFHRYKITSSHNKLFRRDLVFDVCDTTRTWPVSYNLNKIPKIKISSVEMLPLAGDLLKRLKVEFDKYLKNMDDDERIAMIVHPIAFRYTVM
jgi:hypothetical protein